MSEAMTNPDAEVEKPQLNMFDVMFGSEETTNPEQTIEEPSVDLEEMDEEEYEEISEESEEEYEIVEEEAQTETPEAYTVKVDGEEFEVSLEELRDGYQRQADYTRKSQSLAEQRKAYEANLQAVQKEREEYSKALDFLSSQQNADLERFKNIDWVSLKQDDPMEYMEKRLEFQDAQDKIAHVNTERARVVEQATQDTQNFLQEKLQEEAKILAEKLPEYADPSSTLRNDIRQYTLGLGFSPEDVDGITDHKVVLVLHKAMMADKGIKSASTKKSKSVPKVVKSGTPQTKAQKAKKGVQAKRERLAKTGHTRDAANVFLDLLES